jgi:hypothetical protein
MQVFRGALEVQYKCYKLLAFVVQCSSYWRNICCLLSDPLTSALPTHFLFPRLCTGAHLRLRLRRLQMVLFNLLEGKLCRIFDSCSGVPLPQRKTLLEPWVWGEKFDAHNLISVSTLSWILVSNSPLFLGVVCRLMFLFRGRRWKVSV